MKIMIMYTKPILYCPEKTVCGAVLLIIAMVWIFKSGMAQAVPTETVRSQKIIRIARI